MGFIIREFIWDIPVLIFAYVLLSGPITVATKMKEPAAIITSLEKIYGKKSCLNVLEQLAEAQGPCGHDLQG